jgi:glucose/arabinose dehydrogenase
MRIWFGITAIALSCIVTSKTAAQTLPDGFAAVKLGGTEPFIPFPTAFSFAPDGRIFVTQQDGKIRIIKDDLFLPGSFYETPAENYLERGMSGIVLDPDFDTNHYVYVYFTVKGDPSHNRLLRVTADGDKAVEGSEQIILDFGDLGAAIHNGGAMTFGNDGKLYLAVGDNSSGTVAQDLDSYFGKVLRINKDGSVPTGNPFPTGSEQRKRIWSYGLRNPFSLGFNPVDGRLFINDVGNALVEEINDATLPGLNFGWPISEGPTSNPLYKNPIYSYQHNGATHSGCAIVGGDFVPPNANYPLNYVGKYFFFDLCNHAIYYIDPSETAPAATMFCPPIADGKLNMVGGPDGNLYFITRAHQELYKIVYSASGFPIVTAHPLTKHGFKDQSQTFTTSVAGQAPFTYQWIKDGEDIADATESTYTIPSLDFSDAGGYSVKITNAVGSVESYEAQLTVIENTKPEVHLLTPLTTGKYVGGGVISFSAEGTDPEDGTLPEEAFKWYIDFHHNTHKHDQPPVNGSSGTFNVPERGETSSNVWYRFIVEATDAGGFVDRDSVDVYPVVSKLTFTSIPPGAEITLDGQPITTPYSVDGVTGIVRDLNAGDTQQIEGKEYVFANWSNEGEAVQSIITPDVDTEYRITYSIVLGTEEKNRAYVYPTLAQNEIFIPWRAEDDLPEIHVVDTYGRTYAVPFIRASDKLIVNVRDLAPAIYLLKCTGDSERFAVKVAVLR